MYSTCTITTCYSVVLHRLGGVGGPSFLGGCFWGLDLIVGVRFRIRVTRVSIGARVWISLGGSFWVRVRFWLGPYPT